MAASWSSSGPLDCVLGLRDPNHCSGVGLFNQRLAQRLGVPNRPLREGLAAAKHPLISLKFEELTSESRQLMARCADQADERPFSLFLHTLDRSPEEFHAVQAAAHVFCGNDWIIVQLAGLGLETHPVRAFAPGLIEEPPAARAKPAIELFSFGMAGKVDMPRFERLAQLLGESACDYRLSCSLAVHQTSDGACLPRAVAFFEQCFGNRFLHLGTLSDAGVSYFLRSGHAFVGFYRRGVRSNNTTFNTALECGSRIVTNLDVHSPPEVRDCPSVLNLDDCGSTNLTEFLSRPVRVPIEQPLPFGWDRLLGIIEQEIHTGPASVARPQRHAA